LSDRSNNLFAPEQSSESDPFESEFVTFAGLNLTQPLLKNRGKRMTQSEFMAAKIREKMALDMLRRQKMASIAEANSAFLAGFITQEALSLRTRSLDISKSLLSDMEATSAQGKATDLEVDAARAAVKLRQIRLLEAKRAHFEAVQNLLGMVRQTVGKKEFTLIRPELPKVSDKQALIKKYSGYLDHHPDRGVRQKELDIAKLRLDVSANQKLPELNLIGSFGYNGLGDSVSESMDKLETTEFDSWSVGLVLRVPLGKGREGQTLHKQAILGHEKASMLLEDTETKIENTFQTAIERLLIYHDYYEAQKNIVEIGRTRLDNQRELVSAGKSTTGMMLQVEEELAEAEAGLLDVMARLLAARAQLELSSGKLLETYDVEFSE
jgi:outer membrane protein TolC